jgi:hypothetical protein
MLLSTVITEGILILISGRLKLKFEGNSNILEGNIILGHVSILISGISKHGKIICGNSIFGTGTSQSGIIISGNSSHSGSGIIGGEGSGGIGVSFGTRFVGVTISIHKSLVIVKTGSIIVFGGYTCVPFN